MSALERWTESLLVRGDIRINLNEWSPWSADILSLFLRTAEAATSNNWNASTPDFSDLTTKMQSLIDLWFQKSDGVMQAVADKCIQGEIDYLARGDQILSVGYRLINYLRFEGREELIETWESTLNICLQKVVTWQANVVTSGEGFFSDISVGSQAETGARDGFGSRENLEVEYIDGA